MYFQHSAEMWKDFPELVPGVIFGTGITGGVSVASRIGEFYAIAESRLRTSAESELPEIQAWRRTFSKMDLKPTQYRCASESLLRRFKKERSLPHIHPLIDLCNAVSLAFAIPVAVFDVSRIGAYLEVRYASGGESYETFGGGVENPQPHEVIFADNAGRAHARRWTNRQSACSAVQDTTSTILIVAEGMHDSAPGDVRKLSETLVDELTTVWSGDSESAILSSAAPRFNF
jgi:DNA/RNA-binding domain of Phe-tRNA-synthetase-like protein